MLFFFLAELSFECSSPWTGGLSESEAILIIRISF